MRMTISIPFAGTAGLSALIFVASTMPASAYVGPGLGLGAVSTALGVVGAIILGIIAFIWYPVKRLIRRVRARFAAPATPVLRQDDRGPVAEEIVS
ncbi:hypothetical protein [Novosphingobium sp.]|uniref:hypothetical protein n=1 Tax=Novosphingobium sp. TaxID=1874826 RepID=UPI003B52CC4B